MATEKKRLQFWEEQTEPGRKTKVWRVTNAGMENLGQITWHAPWRRFVFAPNSELPAVFDVNCLTEIQSFINARMDAWRASQIKKMEHKSKKINRKLNPTFC